jgi:hypothetical protein
VDKFSWKVRGKAATYVLNCNIWILPLFFGTRSHFLPPGYSYLGITAPPQYYFIHIQFQLLLIKKPRNGAKMWQGFDYTRHILYTIFSRILYMLFLFYSSGNIPYTDILYTDYYSLGSECDTLACWRK